MPHDPAVFLPTLISVLTVVALRILGAIAIWFAGRWLIHQAIHFISVRLLRRHLDPTLVTYAGNTLGVLLTVALVAAILGFFGVETTTFAALVAAGGVAIGVAWGGLLSNFAAGAFLVVLRPFAVGDFVSAGGVTGTVEEIGLFVTTIDTPDNVRTFVGNAKILGDTIQNFSANPFRRVDLTAQLPHDADPAEAIRLLKARVAAIPNVVDNPPPDVELLEFNLAGPVLAVRPYTANDSYWQVYFDTNLAIRQTFGAAGYPVPEQRFATRGLPAGAG